MGHDRLSLQWFLAEAAAEARGPGVPVPALVSGLLAVDTDELATGLAELRVEALEAAAAAGSAALHDVPLPPKRQVAL